ncbi:MAG: hypothetical protein HY681_01835 [Chloroflexi bacterium]|nr:hypothetical protein [Chloroflexota bacterium]
MDTKRIISIIVFIAGLAAAVNYTVRDEEAQGAVVVLVAILFFMALPHIMPSKS